MNKNRVKEYINIWLRNIELEGISELEKDIGMNISDFVVEILDNLYKKYSDIISYIPKEMDNYNNYIINSKDDIYSLEDFLLNRLLRSVTSIKYRDESQTFSPDSHYAHEFGEILIDKNRIQNQLSDIRQKRKLVAHELLHSIKTQFYDGLFFEGERYEKMKMELRGVFGDEINSFSIDYHELVVNDWYKHSGLSYCSKLSKNNKRINIDLGNLDEIINDKDAIDVSNDNYKEVHELLENCFIVISNPESSNAFISNYAFILERIIDKKTMFIGLYLEPVVFCQSFNSMYTSIFQKKFNSDKSALEIFSEQLKLIKSDPFNTEQHILLLNTLYECIEKKYVISGYDNDQRVRNICCIGNKGLLELVDGRLQPLSELLYCNEYNNNRKKAR